MLLIGEPKIVPVIVVLPFAEVTEVSSGAGLERGIALLEDSSLGVVVDVAVAEAVVGRPVDRLRCRSRRCWRSCRAASSTPATPLTSRPLPPLPSDFWPLTSTPTVVK